MNTAAQSELCPSKALQDGKTEFYEAIQDKALEHRQRLTKAMTWLRPVDRLTKSRRVSDTDRLLIRLGEILEQSRADDVLLSKVTDIDAVELSSETYLEVRPLDTDLDNDTAAQTAVAIVEHS